MKRTVIFGLIAWYFLTAIVAGCKGKPPVAGSPDAVSMEIVMEPMNRISDDQVPPTASVPGEPRETASYAKDKQKTNKMIQQALKKARFYQGAIDGIIGPQSKKAIREFQKANGIALDGKVGPKTWALLKQYL